MSGPEWWGLVSPAAPAGATRFTIPPAAPGAAGGDGGDVEGTIRRIAQERGFSDPDLLVATARQESGLNPRAVGDSGNSRGIFQENVRGRGANLAPEQSFDPVASTNRAIDEFSAIRRRFPDADRGTWAARAQRPADAAGYAQKVNALLGTALPAPSAQTGATPSGAPSWWSLVQTPGVGDQKGGVSGAAPARSGGASPQGGAVFPVAGYTGKVEFHHGSREALGGSDLFAPEGTPVVAMAPGKVQWASNDSLGGHNVGVLGDDGLTYYYAHFKNAPRVKTGDRVGAGTQIGDVGRSGNAANTPPHLHIGIGRGIQTGAGAQGGLGREFDAVSYLRQTLTGAAAADPAAPGVGRLTSTGSGGPAPGGANPSWWSLVQ